MREERKHAIHEFAQTVIDDIHDERPNEPPNSQKAGPFNMVQITLTFASLAEAQEFLDDCASDEDATAPTPLDPAKPRRGRKPKAVTVETAAAQPPGHMTKMVAETKALNTAAATTKEQLFAAASKLIEVKGEGFASAFLAEKFAPHARFSEIPQPRWGELVAAVEAALAPAAKPSLI